MIKILLNNGSTIVARNSYNALACWYLSQSRHDAITEFTSLDLIPTEEEKLYTYVIAACERNWNKTPKININLSIEVQCRMWLEWLRKHGDIKRIFWKWKVINEN